MGSRGMDNLDLPTRLAAVTAPSQQGKSFDIEKFQANAASARESNADAMQQRFDPLGFALNGLLKQSIKQGIFADPALIPETDRAYLKFVDPNNGNTPFTLGQLRSSGTIAQLADRANTINNL